MASRGLLGGPGTVSPEAPKSNGRQNVAYQIPVNGLIETVWMGTLFGQRTMTVLHWKNTGTLLSDGLAALALVTGWMKGGTVGTAYKAATSADWKCYRVQAQLISPTRYRAVVDDWAGEGVGDVCGTANTGTALLRYGQTADRHSTGTLHMPGLPLNAMIDGKISATQKLSLSNLLAYWIANNSMGTTTTFTPVLFNRTNAAASVTVVGGTVQDTVRIDRRRTVGVGI